VAKVQAQNIYADESGSVARRSIEENNGTLTANIRDAAAAARNTW